MNTTARLTLASKNLHENSSDVSMPFAVEERLIHLN